MRIFKDTRGRSWFDIVEKSPYQTDITVSYPGTIRGFHYHDYKTEWMFVAQGHYKFVLTNPKEILYLSQGEVVEIIPGRWHGYQNIGTDEGIIMEIADKRHNLDKPDDKRKPYNEFDNWEKEKK
jgi:dTDP-4-dehydrorhamnose 3,5-epimerase